MIEVQKRYVQILCTSGISIKGFVNILGDQRLPEYINNPQELFLILHEAELEGYQSFKLALRSVDKKANLILNKSAIRWITEIEENKN